ncbi:MAG: UbiD family decarboxylase [Halanaeroarchaeum sp.]
MNDIRDFLDRLRAHDQLTVLEGADWDLEIGGVSDLVRRDDLETAVLFDDVAGYEPGRRVLTNAFDTPLQASLALGYEPTSSLRKIVETHADRAPMTGSTPPETVASGPVTEHVLADDEVDLTAFPVPKWHARDGGRYVGTGDVVVTRHPETGTLNAGTYRTQVHGPATATVYISPGKDGRRNRDGYLDRGEPAPMVVSVGHAPDLFVAANERLPEGVNELEYAGSRRGAPVEVVEGEMTGLPIPATAELVLEGHVYPDDERVTEGPFGEWTGYYGSGQRDVLPLTVERLYHRTDPIILGYNVAIAPSALSVIRSAGRLWDELEQAGVPGIEAVNAFMPGPYFQVIAVDQQYAGHSTQVGMQAISLPAGAYHGRFTVVVDADVDVYDWQEVLWALSSRCDPAEDVTVVEDCWSTPLDPRIPPERKDEGDLTNSRAVLDATRPYHWREAFPGDARIDDALATRLREKFGDALFDAERPDRR